MLTFSLIYKEYYILNKQYPFTFILLTKGYIDISDLQYKNQITINKLNDPNIFMYNGK